MHALSARVAFDGTRFLPEGATVLVEGDTIVGVESAGYDVPADCPVTTYDGTLLPGLFDAHVHLVSDSGMGSLERSRAMSDDELDAVIAQSLQQQVAVGVTTVRDLGDTRYRTLVHRDCARPRTPRIVAAGPPITVPDGHCHYLGGAADGADDVRRAVVEHAERGVDVIKVMASGGMTTAGTDVFGIQLSPGDLRLLVDTAHELGLMVLAHAHSLAGIEHALDAGVDGIEHFTGLTAQGVQMPDAVLERVAEAGVTVDPTFGFDPAAMANMPGPPPRILEVMKSTGMDFEAVMVARRLVAGRMRAHGVRVVSGVDAGASPPKAHGNIALAIADLLVAGFPADESLATATAVAADSCGLGDVTGSLKAGLSADLLVVDGDLRPDPSALARPVSVLVRGVDALG